MDRRQFLAASGLAAATPTFALSRGGKRASGGGGELFKSVDLISDGLALSPREYAALLQEATVSGALAADNYSNGGLVEQVEAKFAQLLGKEAAMFVPTGTLANHLAIRKLAGNDRRMLVQAESHFYNDSGDCAETLSGLNLIPLAAGRSTLDLADVKHWVERSAGGRVAMKAGVISIESPVRRKDHEMVDFGELERVCRYAREQGIRLHLDGARLFNLPLHSGKSVREYAALFDTVFVSLWKHFNGSYGAILAGDADFIEGLYHTRRMFGGSLPQAWPGVATVMKYADRYEDDYAMSWRVADRWIALLEADGRFKAEKLANGTCKFYLTATGVAPDVLRERLGKRGITLARPRPGTQAHPVQVNPTLLRTSPESLARAFIEAMKG